MNHKTPLNVLFLCTHNSARSILAEATLNHIGGGRFKAWSAGSSPRENQQPNPLGLQVLQAVGIDTSGLRSKNWDEFAGANAPRMDLIITVCDNAAGEVCPVWPGQPVTAHWGVPDPAAVQGSKAEIAAAFAETYGQLRRRLEAFSSLPVASLDGLALKQRLHAIHRQADQPARA